MPDDCLVYKTVIYKTVIYKTVIYKTVTYKTVIYKPVIYKRYHGEGAVVAGVLVLRVPEVLSCI